MLAPPLPDNENDRIHALGKLKVLDTPAEERFDRLTRLAKTHFKVPITLISLVDTNRQWFKSCQGLSARETPRDISFCGHAILNDDLLVINDASTDDRFADNPLVTGPPFIRFYAGAPLHGPGGARIGTLCIIDDKPREFSTAEKMVLGDMAGIVDAELERTRLLEVFAIAEDLALVAEHTTNGAIIADEKGMTLWVNRGFETITGYTLDEILGRRPGHLLQGPETDPATIDHMRTCLARGEGFAVEILNYSKQKTPYWLDLRVQPIRDDKGTITKYISIFADITERKQLTLDFEAQMGAIRNSQMVAEFQLDGILINANEIFCNAMGYTLEEVRGKHHSFFLPQEESDLAAYRQFWAELKRGEFQAGEFLRAGKDNKAIWIQATYTPVPDPNGKLLKVIKFATDISVEVANRNRLAISEARTTAILNTVVDGIVTISHRGIIETFNPAAQHLFGYSSEEVIGQNINILMPSPYQEAHDGYLRNYLETGEAKVIGIGREVEGRRKDGTTFPMELSVSEMQVEGRRYFTGIVRDITQRKVDEQTLVNAKEEADLANRSKSDFLANMSHEIRTPMNAIIGMSHLALKTHLDEKQQDYLLKIQSSAHSLLGIINDILDFSKIEAGKLSIESITFHLDAVLDHLATISSIKAEEKGLELLFSRSPELPNTLIGDPLRLGQILINLTNNAIKFTSQGEIVVRAEPAKDEMGRKQLRFTVQDTGIGMTAEQTAKLFRPFSQADTTTTRKYGGTGLGLSISKRLVELMDGEIGVTSTLGEGSSFTFTAWFGHQQRNGDSDALLSANMKGMRVLVADDNQTSRTILTEILESMSFIVKTVNSGAEAIDELETSSSTEGRNPYQVALIDWKMPHMTGIETIRHIRASTVIGSMPKLILVTAYGREEIIDEAETTGVDGIILKPVNPSLVLDTIMDAFGGERTTGMAKHQPVLRDVDAIKGILGAKALLVEDNHINQQIGVELLEDHGIGVTVAANGQEAVEMIQADCFDIVLMDIQMPVMDGLEATRRIRQFPQFKKLPILAMTAHAMAGDREKSLDAGMNDHLTKPIDPDALFDALVRWIPKRDRGTLSPAKPLRQSRSTPALPDNIPGIELATGLKLVRGNHKLFFKLLREFEADYKDVSMKVKDLIKKGSFSSAQRIAHTIKGVAGSIGASPLSAAAGSLEECLKNGTYENLDALVSRFQKENVIVMSGLSSLRKHTAKVKRQAENGPGAPHILLKTKLMEQLLTELARLLDRGHATKSSVVLERVHDQSGGALNSELEEIQMFIEDFEYEQALESLQKLATSLDIKLTGLGEK